MTDEQLAERVARADYGEGWDGLDEHLKAIRIGIWCSLIQGIRDAGLEIVEAEEGR